MDDKASEARQRRNCILNTADAVDQKYVVYYVLFVVSTHVQSLEILSGVFQPLGNRRRALGMTFAPGSDCIELGGVPV